VGIARFEEATVEIRISTRHGNLSEQTRERIAEKLGKLSRLFERLESVELTIDLEHREAGRRIGEDGAAASQTKGEAARPSSQRASPAVEVGAERLCPVIVGR